MRFDFCIIRCLYNAIANYRKVKPEVNPSFLCIYLEGLALLLFLMAESDSEVVFSDEELGSFEDDEYVFFLSLFILCLLDILVMILDI